MATDFRAQILQATDLVELISQSVALKRRGKDYLGLCPFHQEKTPSFHVSPGKQTFYCFGCKAGGTAIDFVMRRDRVEFKEALETLARMANIELPQFGGSQAHGQRQALLDAHSAACRFFENSLQHPEQGAAARNYLAKRGFTADTLKRFAVGFAPDGWDGLLRSPAMKKFSPELLASAGLVKPRANGSGFYDTFRGRIMFPIRTESGQIIAFGGRVMPGSEDPAKYLNSPETALFSKSRAVFGLDLARQRIVETRTVAVVEGYTDTAMAHQYGASNVVSVLGTALTEQHVGILRRFADKIVLLFDADAAGDAAVGRSVQLFLTHPIEIGVASIPDGLDPDEYLLKHGIEAFGRMLSGATDALEYAWKQMRKRFVSREGDLTGQQKAIEEYLSLLAGARSAGPVDPIRWGGALVRVSRLTGIDAEELNSRFRTRHRGSSAARPRMGVPEAAEPARPSVSTARNHAERHILGVLLAEPQRWADVQLSLGTQDFVGDDLRRLAEVYWSYQRDEGEPVLNELVAALPDDGLKTLALELVQEAEALGDLGLLLRDAKMEIDRQRQEEKARQIVAGRGQLSDEALLELAKHAARTNLKRI